MRVLLAALSHARLSSPTGLWMDSPDLAGWLLQHGKDWTWTHDWLPPKAKPGKDGYCYGNARALALDRRMGLHYVEGYAMHNAHTAPVNHAWCVNAHGQVIDPTWFKRLVGARRYFGVRFRPAYVERFMRESGSELSILLWSAAGWPVQNGLHQEWEA